MSSASPYTSKLSLSRSLSYLAIPVGLCVGLWFFYFLIEKFCYVSDRTLPDIEQGFPRSQPRNPSEEPDDQKEDKAFKEVSWAGYREKTNEEITKYRSECVICIQEFKDEDECRVRSKCNHIYHKTCIEEWLYRNRHCPHCRGSVRGGVPIISDENNDQNELV